MNHKIFTWTLLSSIVLVLEGRKFQHCVSKSQQLLFWIRFTCFKRKQCLCCVLIWTCKLWNVVVEVQKWPSCKSKENCSNRKLIALNLTRLLLVHLLILRENVYFLFTKYVWHGGSRSLFHGLMEQLRLCSELKWFFYSKSLKIRNEKYKKRKRWFMSSSLISVNGWEMTVNFISLDKK